MSLQNFMVMHLVVNIFQSVTKWLADGWINIAIPGVMLLTWLQISLKARNVTMAFLNLIGFTVMTIKLQV